jgi:hypothetical protein
VNDRHHIQHPHMTVAAVLNTSYYYWKIYVSL